MRINEITEAQVKPYKSKNLSIEAAVNRLNTYCKESIALIHNPIWRGMTNHRQEIVMIDPSTGMRKSENTSNHYTILIDTSPHYVNWPKRSKSLVCSTDRAYAYGYSQRDSLYAIFPFDGVKVAVCPDEDIWHTAVNIPEFDISEELYKVNRILSDNFRIPATSFSAMVGYIQTPQFANLFWQKLNPKFKKVVPSDMLDILYRALAPHKVGFKLLSTSELANAHYYDNEVWFSGPCIAIREDLYKRFVEEYDVQNDGVK